MPNKNELAARQKAPLATPADFDSQAVTDISGGLNALLADVFALYLKTKNFHWHMSGPHFRDYHLLLDEHADQIYSMTDEIAERVRKIGRTTIRSIGHIARLQRVQDNDADYVEPADMLSELREDEKDLAKRCSLYTAFAMMQAMSLLQASSKIGSIKQNVVFGSSLKQLAAKTFSYLVRDGHRA